MQGFHRAAWIIPILLAIGTVFAILVNQPDCKRAMSSSSVKWA
jgi:hypothetical protein